MLIENKLNYFSVLFDAFWAFEEPKIWNQLKHGEKFQTNLRTRNLTLNLDLQDFPCELTDLFALKIH